MKKKEDTRAKKGSSHQRYVVGSRLHRIHNRFYCTAEICVVGKRPSGVVMRLLSATVSWMLAR